MWELPDPVTGICDGEKEKTDDQYCNIDYFQATEGPEQGEDWWSFTLQQDW